MVTNAQLEEVARTAESIADAVERELRALRSLISYLRHEAASTDEQR